MKPRIAIDLDLTLGETIIPELSNAILGFRVRPGCVELLQKLRRHYILCLWSISNRWYVNEVLSFGLKEYFDESLAGDEISGDWKDIRMIEAEYLIDDNPYHRNLAEKNGLKIDRYIIVPAFGSPEDRAAPMKWVQQVEDILL